MRIRIWTAAGIATAALALGGIVVPAGTAYAASSSLCPTYVGTYRIQNDQSVRYMTSEGYKNVVETTGEASTFSVYDCGSYIYQFQVYGANDLCLEYSGNGTDQDSYVIADTCYSTRASQQWFLEANTGSSPLAGDEMQIINEGYLTYMGRDKQQRRRKGSLLA
jgi:hypothetical protein